MAQHVKKRSHKTGLPPGTPVHIGERKSESTRVTSMHFDDERVIERDINTPEEIRALREGPGMNWFTITGLHDIEKLTAIGSAFDLYPLVLEDVFNTDQRPKFEDYGEYVFIVLKRLGNNSMTSDILTEQISLILGRNTVVAFLESESGIFDGIRERLRSNRGRMRKSGADFLVYTLIDNVVDNYFAIFETLGERIETLQDTLITQPTPEALRTLHVLKREILFLRKSVWPLREVVSAMQRGDSPLIQLETRTYLRDVYDHTIHVIDTIETYRDMLSGMLDIYLSSLSNRLNEVIKVLTIIATVFMPLTFIVGIYGMNFHNMPELSWRWGYPAVLLLLGLIAGGMLVYFRRKKWI